MFVSYGSAASSAVCLLLKELLISKGANISAHLTTVYLGGPPLGSGTRLPWNHGLWPTPYGKFILGMWVTASLYLTYGSSISRWAWALFFLILRFFVKGQLPLLQLTSSCTAYCNHSHITLFLFDFDDLTFSSTHKFLQRNFAFWGWDLFVNFHDISLYIQIDRPTVACHVGLCCCSLVLRVHS